jgi:hypothetical protein
MAETEARLAVGGRLSEGKQVVQRTFRLKFKVDLLDLRSLMMRDFYCGFYDGRGEVG